jgi:hypothetical protein
VSASGLFSRTVSPTHGVYSERENLGSWHGDYYFLMRILHVRFLELQLKEEAGRRWLSSCAQRYIKAVPGGGGKTHTRLLGWALRLKRRERGQHDARGWEKGKRVGAPRCSFVAKQPIDRFARLLLAGKCQPVHQHLRVPASCSD